MAYRLVTVFGGSGFLGRHVVRRLAARGYGIRVAVRRPQLASFLLPLGAVGQIVPVQANVRDNASTARAMAGADAVINLVGVRGPSGRQTLGNICAQAPRRLGRLAQAAGIPHLIHVSILGASLDARSHLARAKTHGEMFLREFLPDATIVRPATMFGPDDHFFNMIASRLRFTPVLPVVEGQTRVQPVYVGDVADAIVRILDGPTPAGATYELGGPRVFTVRELIEMVLRETGRRRVLIPIPFKVALAAGLICQYLPGRVVAADDVRQVTSERIVSGQFPGLAELGIAPTTLELVLPTYMSRFQPSDFRAGAIAL